MLPLRITVIDHQTRKVVCERSFDELPVRIGRHEDNHLALPYAFISAWHAEIRREGEELRLCDLGARNGLAIGARRIDPGSSVVIDRCVIAAIGPLELRLEPTAPDAPAPTSDEPTDMPDFNTGPRELPAKSGTIDADVLPDMPDATAGDHAERIARINASIHALRPKHAALDTARRAWEASLNGAIGPLQAARDALGVNMLLREFPARDRAGFALADAGGGRFSDEQERGAVAQAAAELLPGLRAPADEDEARRFLSRAIDVLRVFAACALELQHTRGQQATELGVRWRDPDDPLAAMETAQDVLRYLLDWRDTGEKRSEELVRLFTGLVDHQRAYTRAGLLAARESISSLAPAEVERGAHAAWPTRAAALWRHYEACYAALVGDVHDHVTPLFRAALARGYAETLARVGVGFRVQLSPEGS